MLLLCRKQELASEAVFSVWGCGWVSPSITAIAESLTDFMQVVAYKKGTVLDILSSSLVAPVVKNPPANAGDTKDLGLTPGLERSPGEENGNPLPYSCWENSLNREAWQAPSPRSRRESDMTKHPCH